MSSQEQLEELRKIRELLEKPPPSPPPKGIIKEFKKFLEDYKVLGLAVAFIMAVYLGALVKALVTDLILPLIPVGQNASINSIMVGPFGVGDFANALLTFIIVALVIFLIVKVATRFDIK